MHGRNMTGEKWMRKIIEWNQDWVFVKTAETAAAAQMRAKEGAGEYVTLPHTWNAADGQDGGNDYYRGTCWYVKEWRKPKLPADGRLFVEFHGAAMTADVYLNGRKMAHHEGGYSTFRVDVTDALQADNVLTVSVDNSSNEKVYPQVADFTFYGGLYRSVNLIIVPEVHFALEEAGETGIRVTPEVICDEEKVPVGEVKVTVDLRVKRGNGCDSWTAVAPCTEDVPYTAEAIRTAVASHTQNACGAEDSSGTKGDFRTGVLVEIYDGQNLAAQKRVTVTNGNGRAEFLLTDARLWDGVNDPHLYTARASLDGGDIVETRFGCRSFYADPQKGFFLNGRSYPLRGVSRHQDRAGAGNALTPAMHREDMEIVKEIGANTLRLAHYQHAGEFYDLCDENGIIVWAEIPYITLHMDGGFENTLSQMKELITQNYNHPSIICWGLSNEITAGGGVTERMLENHNALQTLCHELDSSRPTVMANVFMLETDSPVLEIPDWNSYNLYFGWYLGKPEQNDQFFDDFHKKYPDRVVGFSEFGADANPKYQSARPEQGDYTETYQALYHEHMINMIEARPWIWAAHVWNLFDFAADGRDEGGRNGINQKGLVTLDRKLKKDAFYLYKAHWNRKDAFVHLCGRRYVNRAEAVTEIKVYSNQPEVTLYVDGKETETKQGAFVYRFEIPVSGTHMVEARSGGCRDVITIRKAAEPDPEYCFGKKGNAANWFDRDDLKPGCYSIRDTMGDLQSNPEAAALVERVMAGATAARGDVAEKVKDNPNLKRMMAGMTLDVLLRHAGDSVSEKQARELNRALQQIKKPQ